MEEKARCQYLTGLLIKRLCLGKTVGECATCRKPVCKTHSVADLVVRYCLEHAPVDESIVETGRWHRDSSRSSTSGGPSGAGVDTSEWKGEGGGFSGAGASGTWDDAKPGSSSSTNAPSGSPSTPSSIPMPGIAPGGLPPGVIPGALTPDAAGFTEQDYAEFEKMAQGEEVDPRDASFDS